MPKFHSNVNPSTPRPEGRGLLRVDPERRFFTPPSKAGLGAAEWVKPNNPPYPPEAVKKFSYNGVWVF